MEHFVTLFDSNYLLQGLALHRSLETQGEPFVLWVVCMDGQTETAIRDLGYPSLQAIALHEVEALDPRLLEVKPTRSRGEYCWTLTSFTYLAVRAKAPEAQRVTYLDADLYFWGPASALLREMDESGADVMLTEHAYGPEYMQEVLAGIYCVQFLPFRFNESALEILRWWQDRCLEWCYARFEDGKFGDQKYLDDWPERWGAPRVHVLQDKTLALAPWNVDHRAKGSVPGFFHFHGLRLYVNRKVRLWKCYRLSASSRRLVYAPYLDALRENRTFLAERGITWGEFEPETGFVTRMKTWGRILIRRNELWTKL